MVSHYEIVITSSGNRSIKNLSKNARKTILSACQTLNENPYTGKPLKGEYKNFRSLRVSGNRVQYRVIYQVNEESNTIIVYYAGSRENIYNKLKASKPSKN